MLMSSVDFDEFGEMEMDADFGVLIPDSVIRRESYLARKRTKRSHEINAWARRYGFDLSKTGRRVEPGYVGGHVVYHNTPGVDQAVRPIDPIDALPPVPDVYDGVPHDPIPEDKFDILPPIQEEDDFLRLKRNEAAGKYTGKFKPLGKGPKAYKF